MYCVKLASKSDGRVKPSYTQKDLVAYKLFLAHKLKSILKEQERLKWHLGQLDDLEWGLREHYYTFDDYRTDYLTERYRGLQCRVRQMKDENRHLQRLTTSQLEEYMFAQATLNTSSEYKPEWIRQQHQKEAFDISTLNFLGTRPIEHGASREGHTVGTVKNNEDRFEVVKSNQDIGWSSGEKKEGRREEGSMICKDTDYHQARAEIKTLIDKYFEAKGKSLHPKAEKAIREIRESTWVDTSQRLRGPWEPNKNEIQGTAQDTSLRENPEVVTETSLTESQGAGDMSEINWRENNVINSPSEVSRKISQTSQKNLTSGAVSGSPKVSVLHTKESAESVYSAFTKLPVKQRDSNEVRRSDCGTTRQFDSTLTKPSSKSPRNTTGYTSEGSPRESSREKSLRESPSEKSYASLLEFFKRKMSYETTSLAIQDVSATQGLSGQGSLPRKDTTNIISPDSSCRSPDICLKEAKCYDAVDADFEIISDNAEKYLKESHWKPSKVELPSERLSDSTANSTTFRLSQSFEKYYTESQYDTIDSAYNEFSDNAKMYLNENKTSKVSPSEKSSTPFRSGWSCNNYPKETNYDTIDGDDTRLSDNAEIHLKENQSITSKVSPSIIVSEPRLSPHKDRSVTSSEVSPRSVSNSTVEEPPQFVYSAESTRYILQRQSNTGGISDNASKRASQDVDIGSTMTASMGNTFEIRRDVQSDLTNARTKANHDKTVENSGQSRGGASGRNTQIPSPVGSLRSPSETSSREELKFIYDASSRRYILQRETPLTNQNDRPFKCPEGIQPNTSLKNTVVSGSMSSLKESQAKDLRKSTDAGVKRSQSLLKKWNRPESSNEKPQRNNSDSSTKQAPKFVYSASSKRYILQKDGTTSSLSDRSANGVIEGQHHRAKGPAEALNDEIAGKLKQYETREYYDKWAANGTRDGTVQRQASQGHCHATQESTEDDVDSWSIYEASRNKANLAKKGKLESKQSRIPIRLPARLKEHIWL